MAESKETLSVVQLRDILKAHGVKNTSTMRKAQLLQLVEALGEHAIQQTDTVKEKENQVQSNPIEEKYSVASNAVDNNDERNNELQSRRMVERPQRQFMRRDNEENEEYRSNRDYPQRRRTTYKQSNYSQNQSRENSERFVARNTGYDNSNYRENQREVNREYTYSREENRDNNYNSSNEEHQLSGYGSLDSGMMANGILEVMPEGYGFLRSDNYLPGDADVYVSPAQIKRFNLKTGDIVYGNLKVKTEREKFIALLYVRTVNGFPPVEAQRRSNFEDMTPIFPNRKINLETEDSPISMRIMDLVSPIGRGQRGMIVSPPKTGKTTLLKQVAKAVHTNYPDMNMIILLIDERPEEVTDIKEYIEGDNVEVIYSTFDETPEHHKRVSEMVLERAKRLVEHKKDVVILLDSITRLARAYNLTVPPSGRTLSGGLDPAALHMPKKFFGAARNMREGGSLTVLATALVETGSKMDDVVFEEFKGTGNMELVLDRKLSEKRIFPAINIPRSGTRREELLLDKESLEAMYIVRKALNGMKADESLEKVLDMFIRTKNNKEFVEMVRHTKYI